MSPIKILVDADACPVKEEIYRVAFRREVPVRVVSNAHMRVPAHPLIERVVVSDAFDAADDWIAEHSDAQTVVVTGDILLADRCLKQGATVVGRNGKPFTASSIGGAIATRAIMADLRSGAGVTGGPAPFAKTDRSRFLQALDTALVRLEKRAADRFREQAGTFGGRGSFMTQPKFLQDIHANPEHHRTGVPAGARIRQYRRDPQGPPPRRLFQRRRAPWRRIDQG